MTKIYMNMMTGEITENHTYAMSWFREGDNVAIIVNGETRLTWEH